MYLWSYPSVVGNTARVRLCAKNCVQNLMKGLPRYLQITNDQGGRSWVSMGLGAALTKRAESSLKGGIPNKRYFVAKLNILAFTRFLKKVSLLLESFQQKSSCFQRFSTKVSLPLGSFQQKSACFWRAFNKRVGVKTGINVDGETGITGWG